MFHFSQCVFRKIVEYGLKVQYGEDQDLRKWVKKVMGLALIDTEKVSDMWVALLDDDVCTHYSGLNDGFNDYFTKTWINDEDEPPLFPISLWNHYRNPDERTNNNGEGYNKRINNNFGIDPNIWKFIQLLKIEESKSNDQVNLIDEEIRKSRGRNVKDIERDKDIAKLKADYALKTITVEQHLDSLSSYMIEFGANKKK
jgi:hypothetical protein